MWIVVLGKALSRRFPLAVVAVSSLIAGMTTPRRPTFAKVVDETRSHCVIRLEHRFLTSAAMARLATTGELIAERTAFRAAKRLNQVQSRVGRMAGDALCSRPRSRCRVGSLPFRGSPARHAAVRVAGAGDRLSHLTEQKPNAI
jgi:hypothetical protein